MEWQRSDPAEIWPDMTALTPNKEEQHYSKLIALIGECESEEISVVLVVLSHNDKAQGLFKKGTIHSRVT